MKDNLYQKYFSPRGIPLLAALVDPDKFLPAMPEALNRYRPDFVLVGGSEVNGSTDDCILEIKQKTGLPVLLFPGHPSQLSPHADAVLMLMLLSGRNPDYLIGHHVQSFPFFKQHPLETISTGYILVGDHEESSVCRVTKTKPIPESETERIIATAVAGEIIGNKAMYIEAGSGAGKSLNPELIRQIKSHLRIPVFSGGGIRSGKTAAEHWKAGADVVVVGTAFEENPDILREFAEAKDRLSPDLR